MAPATESTRLALAAITALAIGFLAQSALHAIVLALTYPSALRFFGVTEVAIFYVPTVVMLVTGAPLFCLPTVRERLGRNGTAGTSALLGALGASAPEIWLCANPLHRCFLATTRDAISGVGMILSGAACGAAIYLVYTKLVPTKKTQASDPETV